MTETIYPAPSFEQWREVLAEGSFEEVYEALETVVAQLEDARLPLADSLECYELGMRLAARCDQYLEEAELRISRLDEPAPAPATDPWLAAADEE